MDSLRSLRSLKNSHASISTIFGNPGSSANAYSGPLLNASTRRCPLLGGVARNKGFEYKRPLRHAGFSTGSPKIFFASPKPWITGVRSPISKGAHCSRKQSKLDAPIHDFMFCDMTLWIARQRQRVATLCLTSQPFCACSGYREALALRTVLAESSLALISANSGLWPFQRNSSTC